MSTQREIDELMAEPELDEDGYYLRPHQSAEVTARRLLIGLPEPDGMAPDGGGGIIAEWRAAGRTVRLCVKAEGDAYVYFHSPEGSGLDPEGCLGERLRWLAGLWSSEVVTGSR